MYRNIPLAEQSGWSLPLVCLTSVKCPQDHFWHPNSKLCPFCLRFGGDYNTRMVELVFIDRSVVEFLIRICSTVVCLVKND